MYTLLYTEPTFHNEKLLVQLIHQLSTVIQSNHNHVTDTMMEMITYTLLGVFSIKLSTIWQPTINVLSYHLSQHTDSIWNIIYQRCTILYQLNSLVVGHDTIQQNTQWIEQFDASVCASDNKDRQQFNQFDDFNLSYTDYTTQLQSILSIYKHQSVHSIVPSHSTLIQQLIDQFNVFVIEQYSVMYPTDESSLYDISVTGHTTVNSIKYKIIQNNKYYIMDGAYRLIKQRLLIYLNILASIEWQPTWSTHSQHTLYNHVLLLLSHNNSDIQKLCLDILCGCIHVRSSLREYQTILQRIVDDKTIREQLTALSIDMVHSKHRSLFILVLTRICVPKLFTKTTKNPLKNKILSYYTIFDSHEILHLIQCILIPFRSLLLIHHPIVLMEDMNDYTGIQFMNQYSFTAGQSVPQHQQLIDDIVGQRIQLHMLNNRKIGFLKLLELLIKNLRLSIIDYIQYIHPILIWLYHTSDQQRIVLCNSISLNDNDNDDTTEQPNDSEEDELNHDTISIRNNDKHELREVEQICCLCIHHYTTFIELYPSYFTTDITYQSALTYSPQWCTYLQCVLQQCNNKQFEQSEFIPYTRTMCNLQLVRQITLHVDTIQYIVQHKPLIEYTIYVLSRHDVKQTMIDVIYDIIENMIDVVGYKPPTDYAALVDNYDVEHDSEQVRQANMILSIQSDIQLLLTEYIDSLITSFQQYLSNQSTSTPSDLQQSAINYYLLPRQQQMKQQQLQSAQRHWPQRELNILKLLSHYVQSNTAASTLCTIFVPYLYVNDRVVQRAMNIREKIHDQTIDNNKETSKTNILHVIHQLIPLLHIQQCQQLNHVLQKQYFTVQFVSHRTLLTQIYKKLIPQLQWNHMVYDTLHEFNSLSYKRLNELNNDMKHDRYTLLHGSLDQFTVESIQPVIYCILYDLYSDELSIRTQASAVLQNIIQWLQQSNGSDVIDSIIYRTLLYGIQSQSIPTRNLCLQLIRYCALHCTQYNDIQCLIDTDYNKSFIDLVCDIQTSSKRHAFNILLSDRTQNDTRYSHTIVKSIILPLLEQLLLNHTISNDALMNVLYNVLSTIASRYPWNEYIRLLQRYIRLLNKNLNIETRLVKCVCSIVDSYHFSQLHNTTAAASTAIETEYDSDNDNTECDTDHQSIDVLDVVQNQILVQLTTLMNGGRDKHGDPILRIPIILCIVKLLHQLPEYIIQSELPKLIHTMIVQLKHKQQYIRDVTRKTLVAIIQSIGVNYIKFIVDDMNSQLTKGYQVHVKMYTVWNIIDGLISSNKLQPGEIDSCIPFLNDVCSHTIIHNINE